MFLMRRERRQPLESEATMHLYIETMDATLVEFSPEGRVRFDNEEWVTPGVQDRRAIIHAAQEMIADLTELLQILEKST